MLVGVLGPLYVETDAGVVVAVPRRLERRLLTVLAARAPSPVSQDVLADAMWGDAQPPSARKALQTNVLRLRQSLGAAVIETDRGGYRLGDAVRVDAQLFERDGDRSWWRGDPFEDVADWSSLDGRRAQLVELRARADEVCVESLLSEGQHAAAIAELERLVVEDNTREVRWTLLVQALVAAGRRPDALRAFDRARRTLASELGVSPGVELTAAHEAALRAGGPTTRDDLLETIDRLMADAAAEAETGDVQRATQMFTETCAMARKAGDVRRFADAALGAAGDGIRVALDALEQVTALVREAVDKVPPGPTRTRCRLLARLSVLQSHSNPPSANEPLATTALGIARALGQPDLLATALAAMITAVPDPLRHGERQGWIDGLLALADSQHDERWRRWALPHVAREHVLTGDLPTAIAILEELTDAASDANDVVAMHAASFGPVLIASTSGDWDSTRAAASRVRPLAAVAMLDPAGATLSEMGMLGIIRLLSTSEPPPAIDIEWPTVEMTASFGAWRALAHARAGQISQAIEALTELVEPVPDIEHDGYWLATLSMVADAAHRCRHEPAAAAVADLLEPCAHLTITDPALIYRGSAAHFAGLAADVLGRPHAVDLLHAGLDMHQRHGAGWMVERSLAALER